MLALLFVCAPARADAPHIPEPLYFDLVRGLDARAGELEVNALFALSSQDANELEWSPEVEWSPLGGFAVELELPLHGQTLEAVKVSTQVRLASNARVAHGLQATVERYLDGGVSSQQLYLLAAQLHQYVSILLMLGPRIEFHKSRSPATSLLFNAAMFTHLQAHVAIGIEENCVRSRSRSTLELLPQVHLGLGQHVKLQLGLGVRREAATWAFFSALRVVYER